ncbi:MAG TPA: efflux RND transporter periplasmic adaptor subunit [Candidatus Limnocylindrales bacterium]|nr:efflux RND transporter periplasmic adaptor subunit [Candidatus Limnocylindrales bacterium]
MNENDHEVHSDRVEACEHDERAPRDRLAFHLVRRGLPALALAAVLAGAWLFWSRGDGAPTHEQVAAPQAPVAVRVAKVERETLPMPFRFLGQTEASQVVEIRARVAGHIEARTFTEGERVREGQRLFQIDPRPHEVELTQARARLAGAVARQERARQQLRRFQALAARQSATAGELEEWQTEERVAAAEVESHKAHIAAAELQLGYTRIASPITGMIGRALKDVGSYVDAAQNGLVAVVQQVDPIYVRFSVSEQETLRFRRQEAAGQIDAPEPQQTELEITLADGSVYPHRGRINFVDVQVDERTGTSVVRGQVPNPAGTLRPGQFIHANVLGIHRLDALRVPQSAVLQSPSGAAVFVVGKGEVVESRPVVLGEWSGRDHWIIERGLEAGERIVVDRLMTVRPGMQVTIASEAAPAGEFGAAAAHDGGASTRGPQS